MKSLVTTFSVLFIMAISFGVGYYSHTVEPEVVYVDVPKYVPQVFTQTVVRTETVTIWEKDNWRAFESREQYTEWVLANLVEDMGHTFCVAEALEMQRRAYIQGYQMSTQSLFYGRTEPDDEQWHEVAKAWIGKKEYAADPVTGQVWQIGHAINEVWR